MSALGCAEVCPREQVQADLASLGIIGDDEPIARGAYYPSHIKSGKITNQLMKPADVHGGHCSVWRLKSGSMTVEMVVPILVEGRSNPLHKIVTVPASKIRELKLADGRRAFCVVDECECDQQGNKHEAHAHIALCANARAAGLKQDDEIFVQAYRSLVLMFRRGHVAWEAPQHEASNIVAK